MSIKPVDQFPGKVAPATPDNPFGTARNITIPGDGTGTPWESSILKDEWGFQHAMLINAGMEPNGTPDSAENSQLFKAAKASIGNGANLLSNHNFLIASPDDSQPPPSATPTSYPPGYEVFSGVFANETTGILNLTYIDGRVSFSGGDFYMSVPNTGALENITEFVASVADFDGKPRTRGVSYALVGGEYRVTVGADALEDTSAALTPLGSVKFEQGSVATGHEVQTKYVNQVIVGSVLKAKGLSFSLGASVVIEDYYGGNQSNGSGPMFFKAVPLGTETEDGGRAIDCVNCQLLQMFRNGVPSLKQYGGKDEGALGFDNATAFKNCIDYNSSMILDQSNVGYLIGTSIDLTNRQSGVSIICPGHVGINNLGCYLLGNTGEFAVLDTTGSQRNLFSNFGIKSATGNTNPSKLGCLFARSDVVAFAQFNILDNFVVRMDTDDTAFGGLGSVGIMNLSAEIMTFRDVYAIGNTGCFIGASNFFGVTSQYATLNTSISSCSTFYFEGNTVFDSNGTVGTPLHCAGAQAGQSSGIVYLNGRGGTAGDIGAGGVRFDGACTNWDATFFLEFTLHVAYIENGFRDNKIKFLGQNNENRYILSNSGFTGVNNCKLSFARTVSGAFTPPDYFITGDATDVYNSCDFDLDYDPAVDFVVPTNLQTNRVLCNFNGATAKTIDLTEVSATQFNVVRSDTRVGAGVYFVAGSSPEGVITANVGSLCMSNIGATGRIWKKQSGTGNTGWIEL
jgi:hypothetical protein